MSSNPVEWRLSTAKGANVERVILSGYYNQKLSWDGPKQRVTNYTADTEIGDPSRFDAWKAGTERYESMEAKLHALTEMRITRFYGAYQGRRFLIDDRPPLREVLKGRDVEMRVVGVYQGTFRIRGLDTVDLLVKETTKPLVLVLCAYEAVKWNLTVEKGARIECVILAGYHQQELEWGGPSQSVYNFTKFNQSKQTIFYTYDKADESYSAAESAIRQLTGLPIDRFYGAYTGERFQIDDRPTLKEALKGKSFELHVIGVNYGVGRVEKVKDIGVVEVIVGKTEKPVVLVLTAMTATAWKLKCNLDARIEQVVLNGTDEQTLIWEALTRRSETIRPPADNLRQFSPVLSGTRRDLPICPPN